MVPLRAKPLLTAAGAKPTLLLMLPYPYPPPPPLPLLNAVDCDVTGLVTIRPAVPLLSRSLLLFPLSLSILSRLALVSGGPSGETDDSRLNDFDLPIVAVAVIAADEVLTKEDWVAGL
mmetsp:Transcript_40125/g.78999  ORF Transcript_40125/g.78999 Transcript_40125/m.78999 type:complete len:118 (+) Transcript_40125:355-708(+)